MATPNLTFDHLLTEFSQLSLEDQEMLLDILKKRTIEQKRMKIVQDVKVAQREHRKGLTRKGTVDDLVRDMGSD
ncbi:hypothetical protein [Desulfobacca acetoxidans]|uniref:Uncharacterized protein n=1 Tax=Desulfobacca acetoxidans (strain ATCC 700848 / DSM 11109 / ASRB2) TaxID=880072 RepID=F2NIU5_DESAR|nr:hypothetical protein [Desulfobacca acetoxidans]AEB10639.1 hypothetical protein Desac_2838 [Desulfobacca acetoxidans DSM 11109]